MCIIRILGMSCLLLPAWAAARDCEQEAANMAMVRDCLSEVQAERLATAFEQLLSQVRSKNRESAELLSRAQKSWESFVQDSCAFSGSVQSQQAMAHDVALNCQQAFIDARIKRLEAYGREISQWQ